MVENALATDHVPRVSMLAMFMCSDVYVRATERRRAGKRRIELSLNEDVCFSDQHRKLRGAFCFWDGGEGNRLELSVNESKCEGAGRVS